MIESLEYRGKIQVLLSNRSLGSLELLDYIQEVLLLEVSGEDRVWALEQLRSVDPVMRVIHHFLFDLTTCKLEDWRQHIADYRRRYASLEVGVAKCLLDTGKRIELQRILTHSNSRMVKGVIKHLRKTISLPQRVFQTESFPGGEGRLQGLDLADITDVDLIEDTSILTAWPDVTGCLLGVDQFTQTHWVNKVGSAAIVRAARDHSIPVFILGDPRKKVLRLDPVGERFESMPLGGNAHLILPDQSSTE